MSYLETVKKSFKVVVSGDKGALSEISNDSEATKYGFFTLIIAGIATAIAALNPWGLILNPFFTIIGIFLVYSIYHFLAKFIFGGQATGMQYFRSLSNSFVVYWFTFIPIIGVFLQPIAGTWIFVMNIVILHKIHKLSTWKAVLVALIPLIIALTLLFTVFYSIYQSWNGFL